MVKKDIPLPLNQAKELQERNILNFWVNYFILTYIFFLLSRSAV